MGASSEWPTSPPGTDFPRGVLLTLRPRAILSRRFSRLRRETRSKITQPIPARAPRSSCQHGRREMPSRGRLRTRSFTAQTALERVAKNPTAVADAVHRAVRHAARRTARAGNAPRFEHQSFLPASQGDGRGKSGNLMVLCLRTGGASNSTCRATCQGFGQCRQRFIDL